MSFRIFVRKERGTEMGGKREGERVGGREGKRERENLFYVSITHMLVS